MTEEEKIFAGMLFNPGDPSLKAVKMRSHKLSAAYSRTNEDDTELRAELIRLMLGAFGTGSFMQGPVFFHYGVHTKIGEHTFINYNFTVQDDARVTIGNNCNFGPNCTIVTPCHPLKGDERRFLRAKDGSLKHLCYAKPVVIGNDCWFGANVTVCPGVTIGNDCVIGAGSVVTHDIPSGTVAAGVPCKVLREITEKDSMENFPEILGEYEVIK